MTKAVPQHVSAAFERFWTAYPYRRDNPKAPARVVFARLIAEGVDAEALVAAASRYASFCKAEKTPSLFIPHARKWLNQRYFEDYMAEPDAQASAPAVGPSPDHPLAAMFAEVGEGAWRSYFEPLAIERTDEGAVVTAATGFARDKLARDHGRRIAQLLGPVTWRVRS